jgi:hypothetical protein
MSDQLTAEVKQAVIDNISDLLIDHYMDLEIAKIMVDLIKLKFKNGDYDNFTKFSSFGNALTQDLRGCSNDYHLIIYYDPERSYELICMEKEEGFQDQYEDDWWSNTKFYNYGIPKVEYLQGNVGYINIQCFAPAPIAGDAFVTAMAFLSGSDALIIDLRECVGGDPFTVQFLESYLFDPKKRPKLLLTRYTRDEIPEQQEWTLPYVPGKRLSDIPVYILTSASTFSGGEDLAYSMKHHNRAIIVGEQTGGGAHGVIFMGMSGGFVIVLPNSYALHPETKSNWEGSGVEPDIKTSYEDAFAEAHMLAVKDLIEKADNEEQKYKLNWSLARMKAQYFPYPATESLLKKYTGIFRGWIITYKEGFLYLSQKGSIGISKMLPISETLFTGDAEYNIRFELGDDGNARAITWLARDNDREIIYKRDNDQA